MIDHRIETLQRTASASAGAFGWWRRRRAARRLARLGTPVAARALAEVLIISSDFAVNEVARRALAGLREQPAIDAVCETLIATGGAELEVLARKQAWLPSDPERRALVLFLTGETDRYAELDFDGRLLAAAHASADSGLRARLAQRARRAGRMEWVRAVVSRPRLGGLSDAEWESLIGTLATAGRWEQMWDLARQAPPFWGARLLRLLGERGWRPADPSQRMAFDELAALGGACVEHPPVAAFDDPLILPCGGDVALAPAAAVTPDGTLLAAGVGAEEVLLWHLPSGEPARTIKLVPAATIRNLVITPDGGLLATGASDGTIRLWRLPSGEPANVLRGHVGEVAQLAVTGDGRFLVSVGYGSATAQYNDLIVSDSIRLWRLPSGESAGSISIPPSQRYSPVVVMPDGELLATAVNGKVWLYELSSCTHVASLRLTDRPFADISALEVTPDGRLLIAAGNWGRRDSGATIRVWRLPSGIPVGELPERYRMDLSHSLAVSPDGRLLAHAGQDSVSLWHLPSGEKAGILTDPHGDPNEGGRLAFTPDGRLLVGSGTRGLRFWRLPGTSATASRSPSGARLLSTVDESFLVSAGPGALRLRRYRPSAVDALARKPVTDITPIEVESLYRAHDDPGERALAALCAALVRRYHARDIEVGDEATHAPSQPADIEVSE